MKHLHVGITFTPDFCLLPKCPNHQRAMWPFSMTEFPIKGQCDRFQWLLREKNCCLNNTYLLSRKTLLRSHKTLEYCIQSCKSQKEIFYYPLFGQLRMQKIITIQILNSKIKKHVNPKFDINVQTFSTTSYNPWLGQKDLVIDVKPVYGTAQSWYTQWGPPPSYV